MEIQKYFPWVLLAAAFVNIPSAYAQLLPGHSLMKADANTLNSEWFMGGMTVPTPDTVILSPGVPNRVGVLFSTVPLLTNNFEVSLKLKGRRPSKRSTKDSGFAFWYTPENASSVLAPIIDSHAQNMEHILKDTWKDAFTAAGLDLLFYKSKYEGLGVFFLDEESPTISAIPNDGTKPFKLGAGIPSSDAAKVDFMNDQEHVVKISVHPEGAKIEVGGHTMDLKGAFKAGGYLGFTSFGGTKLEATSEEKGPFLELLEMQVVNNDKAAKGEEVRTTVPPPPPVPEEEKMDVFAEASSFKDHRAESDAIKDLTNVVFKLVVETQPMRHQMERAIASLAKRIDMMETNFESLKAELDKKTGHKLGAEFQAIKHELAELSDVASKETQERKSRMESLHHDIADVHKSAHSPDNIDKHLDKLTASNDKVLDQLTNEHQRMFGVSIAAIAFIVIAGLSLYNKFRCWEKKHVL